MRKNTSPAIEAPCNMEEMMEEALNNPGMVSDCYSQFHDYSFNNVLLIAMQCRMRGLAFGPIGTFNKWKDQGRFVRKGEKALIMCQPVSFQKKDDNGLQVDKNGNPVMVTRFVYRKQWFVLSQTDGEEQEIAAVPGWDMETALLNLKIIKGNFEMLDGNCMGYASGRLIAINPLNKNPLKTVFHEIAHVLLGHTEEEKMVDGLELNRGEKEVEAEMVAYLMGCVCGLDEKSLAESRGYIQSWMKRTGDSKMKEASIGRVMKCVNEIMKAGKVVSETVEV